MRFPKASTNDNAQQCPKNPSLKEGASTAESNLDTTKYHKHEAEMTNSMAVQRMQGWWGAIMIVIMTNVSVMSA
jgi:hypothetical protein